MPHRLHHPRRRHVALALAGLPLALHGRAAWAGHRPDALGRVDRQLLEQAVHDGLASLALGHLASERASTIAVKVFAITVVHEHGQAHEELSALAKDKGVPLPAVGDRSQRSDAERLARLSGAAFDRAYMKLMTAERQKTVSLFERAASSAKDGDLREFAARTLPTLQTHLAAAQNIESVLNAL
jgi:putative membrane protein